MVRLISFELENDRWFAVLPEWEGSKDDLEMVMGADTLLTLLAQGENRVSVLMSDEPLKYFMGILEFQEEIYDGATYLFRTEFFSFNVWLCSVTKFVFGEYPKTIYIDM